MRLHVVSAAVTLMAAQLLCTGCATSSDYTVAAAREERAADDLQQGGTRTGGRKPKAGVVR